jgi:hypothetical protein
MEGIWFIQCAIHLTLLLPHHTTICHVGHLVATIEELHGITCHLTTIIKSAKCFSRGNQIETLMHETKIKLEIHARDQKTN